MARKSVMRNMYSIFILVTLGTLSLIANNLVLGVVVLLTKVS